MATSGRGQDPQEYKPTTRPSVTSQQHIEFKIIKKNSATISEDEVEIEIKRKPSVPDSRRLTAEVRSKGGERRTSVSSNTALFNVWKRKVSPAPGETNKVHRRSDFTFDEVFNTTLLNMNKNPIAGAKNSYFSTKQTKTLGTLVPNEILNKINPTKKDLNTFVGVLLFADVSGFTALCEKYNNTGKGGTYHLTATLNGYIGAMVEVIYSCGGDVLKFSGDAFLAVWKVGKHAYIYNTIHEVLACAMHIQRTLGTYKTDVKVFLKVKLAISAGNVTFCVIGDELSRHYLLGGLPIKEVKAAEHACESGDVVMSASAWGYCSPANYEHKFADEINVKITRILYDPGAKKRVLVLNDVIGALVPEPRTRHNSRGVPRFEGEQGNPDDDPDFYVKSLRISVDVTAVHRRLGGLLRPFMIPPVAQQIDADQPLEFLTEMRQVTTMFVNINDDNLSTRNLLRVTDEAYCIVCRLVRGYMGCVNKVSLFDKDIMMLCIFGLRGYKNELDGHSGLRCAYRVLQELKALEGVRCVSIGVTTGMCYCGVVGHPLRREYTVIGVTVNKAARIMCAYPGKVTCDQVTCVTSKLPAGHFVTQEHKPLKGITTVGAIYEYSEMQRGDRANNHSLPLLGRSEELDTFRSMLKQNNKRGLLVLGEARIGKTRLLRQFAVEAQKLNYTTVLVSLDSYHVTTPYSVAYLVMKQVLGLEESSTVQEREVLLTDLIGFDIGLEWLCYLNTVMQVHFPNSMTYVTDDAETRLQTTRKLFQNLITMTTNKLLVCLDNAHHVDAESWWEFLVDILDTDTSFLALTMYTAAVSGGAGANPIRTALDNDTRIATITLGGLSQAHMAPLACQMLGVSAIPPEIEALLKSSSNGNPGWCESYLMSLLQSGGLSKVDISNSDSRITDLVVPNAELLKARSFAVGVEAATSAAVMITDAAANEAMANDANRESSHKIAVTLVSPSRVVSRKNIRSTNSFIEKTTPPSRTDTKSHKQLQLLTACVISSNFQIRDVIPQNMDVIITQAFDCLPPYDQLFLKVGSVLGDTFSRKMVNAVMPNAALQQTVAAVGRFYEVRILDCGAKPTAFTTDVNVKEAVRKERLKCHCKREAEDGFTGFETLPAYAFCKCLRFCIPMFRATTYDLLPGNQRTEFHARAVTFLKAEPHKCVACGGREMAKASSYSNTTENKQTSAQVMDGKFSHNSHEFRQRMVRFRSMDYQKRKSTIHGANLTDEMIASAEQELHSTKSLSDVPSESILKPSCSKIGKSPSPSSVNCKIRLVSSELALSSTKLSSKETGLSISQYKLPEMSMRFPVKKSVVSTIPEDSHSLFDKRTSLQDKGSAVDVKRLQDKDNTVEVKRLHGKDTAVDVKRLYGKGTAVDVKDTAVDVKLLQHKGTDVDVKVTAVNAKRLHGKGTAVDVKRSFMPLGNDISKTDFRFCECPIKLEEVYVQLIDHCLAADMVEKRTQFLIEYGAVSITLSKNEQAIRLLEEAQQLVTEDIFPLAATRDFNLGKIHSLIGKAQLEMNNLDSARHHIHLALVHHGEPVHNSSLLRPMRVLGQMCSLWLQGRFTAVFGKQVKGAGSVDVVDQLSFCFATLCNIHMMNEKWGHAKLAALRSLKHAGHNAANMTNLLTAYSNALDVFLYYGQLDYCKWLENKALRHCRVHYIVQESNVLTALGQLYYASFIARVLRGELIQAIKAGFRILQICSQVYTNNVKRYVLPQLIQGLIVNGRVGEGIDLLGELEASASASEDESTTAWYRLLCLELLLDAGVVKEGVEASLDYARLLAEGRIEGVDAGIERRIVAAAWLWYLRRKEWDAAEYWEKLAQPIARLHTYSNLTTLVKLLECYLLLMATRVAPADAGNYHWRNVAPLIRFLKCRSTDVKIILPRFLHLHAYSCLLCQRRQKAMELLRHSKQISVEQENDLEEAWADHSLENWSGTMSSAHQDFWLEHSSKDNNIEWPNLILHTWSNILFTLPIDSVLK